MVLKGIVIDTNIIFSALQKDGKIRKLLFLLDTDFFAPNFLIVEILKYRNKIFSLSSMNEDEFFSVSYKVLNKINFINEKRISFESRKKAYELCKDIDEKDTPFIALSLELELPLWTADMKLLNGVKCKGFNNILESKDIQSYLNI
jgi:predicted nucleic acid-binding protein